MIAIKDMEMPNYCTEVINKENKGGWLDASVKRCPLYDVCKEKETVRSNFKPVSCPLVEIVTCKDCKYNNNGLCPDFRPHVSDNFYCADAKRRE